MLLGFMKRARERWLAGWTMVGSRHASWLGPFRL